MVKFCRSSSSLGMETSLSRSWFMDAIEQWEKELSWEAPSTSLSACGVCVLGWSCCLVARLPLLQQERMFPSGEQLGMSWLVAQQDTMVCSG